MHNTMFGFFVWVSMRAIQRKFRDTSNRILRSVYAIPYLHSSAAVSLPREEATALRGVAKRRKRQQRYNKLCTAAFALPFAWILIILQTFDAHPCTVT